ncbi:MAG: DUF4249 domain-containing protein [Candidatus Cyclobacteriaceae bacterium M3_2C_046]
MKNTFLFFVIVFIMACETIVDIEVPYDQDKLSVQSYFNPDSSWVVFINNSRYILGTEDYQTINNAAVEIFENDIMVSQLIWDEQGYYRSQDHQPGIGPTYRIEVQAPGYEAVSAQASIPAPVQLSRVTVDTTQIINRDYNQFFKMKIEFKDPAQTNYYKILAKVERIELVAGQYWDGTTYRDTTYRYQQNYYPYLEALDPSIDDEQYGDGILLDDSRFNGKDFVLECLINMYDLKGLSGFINDTDLSVLLQHVSEEKYLFEKSAGLQDENDGNPFAEPVPVFNNIHNGFGIFAGYSQFELDVEF